MSTISERMPSSNSDHIQQISASCGKVAVGCSDVAGLVQSVLQTSRRLREEHDTLRQTVIELEADQQRVAQATDEAALLSGQAINQLAQGTLELRRSLGEISRLVELVGRLADRVTGFAAAMKQVRDTSKKIEHIAETTRILALNAKIEAINAGEAGQTFLVVADEVKGLSADTRKATEEITSTIEKLNAEASDVISEIENGVESSHAAKSSIHSIEKTIDDVAGLVRAVCPAGAGWSAMGRFRVSVYFIITRLKLRTRCGFQFTGVFLQPSARPVTHILSRKLFEAGAMVGV